MVYGRTMFGKKGLLNYNSPSLHLKENVTFKVIFYMQETDKSYIIRCVSCAILT